MSKVVQSRTKTASASKAAPVVKKPAAKSKPKALVSVKAEPISEDEFELESKREAKEYAERQTAEHKRASIQDENKRRKEQGLNLLPVPRKIKDKTKKILGYGSEGISEEDEDEELPSRRKRKRNEDDEVETLQYEGQRILPFNPLFALTGVPIPSDKSQGDVRARQTLLADYFRSSPHLEVKHEELDPGPSSSKMTIRNGILVKKQDVPPEPVKVEPVKVEQEEEEEEAEYNEDDDEVIAPWSKIKVDEVVEEEEEEGVYSEDDLFTPDLSTSTAIPSQSSQSQSQSQSQSLAALNHDIPAQKPRFPYTDTQAQIGPLLLDNVIGGVSVPAPINMFLKEYQRAGVRFFYEKYKEGKGGILGDDMGLGKTIQVIAFLTAIMRKTNTRQDDSRRKTLIRSYENKDKGKIPAKHWPTALIVCPSSLIRNWDREMDAWGYFEKATLRSENCLEVKQKFENGFLDVILASYDQLKATIEHVKDMPFSVVIADEAHRLKEPRAARTLAMKKIRCTSCFALTGTLMQNRMDEMWSVLDFVQRGWAGTLKEWRDFAVNPIKKGHRLDGTAEEVTMGIMRLGQVHQKFLPHFYLRRDKRLIAHELPEKKDLVVFCPLAKRQILAYQRLIQSDDIQFILRRKEPCDCGSGLPRVACHHAVTAQGETVNEVVLKNITALQKVANHFGLLYHSKDDPPEMRKVNERIFETCTGRPYDKKQENPAMAALDPNNCGKWTLLAGLIEQWRNDSEQRNKVLIFSNSVRLLKMIYEFITMSFSFGTQMYTGEANERDRMDMVDNFQDPEQDQFIMLISTQAGGVGLNLTQANKVVLFDPDWNPANDLQAMDRAFRIGQQRTVEVYRLIGLGTLEELKYERQIHKQQRARQLNQGTFERRMHQGMDGGKTAEEQGELFGSANIFRFDPKGFVAGNLERVQLAEDRFAQDLIDAEYDEEEEDALADGEDDDEARKMLKARREQDLRRQARSTMERSKREENRKISDVLGDADDKKSGKGPDILAQMGILSHIHDTAFSDSPAERQIYEIGVQLLKDNPALARTMKANDLGKLGLGRKRNSSAARKSVGDADNAVTSAGPSTVKRMKTDPDDKPWEARLQGRKANGGAKKLVTLSDDE